MKWPCMSTEKYPQHMPLLGEAMAIGLVSGVKGRQGYLYDDEVYLVFCAFFGQICIKASVYSHNRL